MLDASPHRLDQAPDTTAIRKQTVESPFGTLKTWIGSTYVLTRTLKRVDTEIIPKLLAAASRRLLDAVTI